MLNYSLYTDHELTSLLKEDDHTAFTEIYKRYWKKMLLIAWNHSNDNTASKDIVHEVFISLWERRHVVEVTNLPAFLATSVKFSIYKYYQRENRRSELARLNYEFNELTNDEAKLDALFLREYIDGIVEEMPERCRLVFRYSREMGLKNHEIATRISITEKAVEANLTRALKIIRAELKNYGWTILLTLYTIYAFLK
ncbi:sigma-70 family RNA polymerase sigma factor [Mucilaginibacter ginsenosidivorans]|uniref:Sigma-70 family RNA polymerase sigma factor n=1 Tax=Mucilaginibacter ginsenosidivorans TaxID=398053 RepID=A0A5B8UTM3_9SPHI|nr:sigma-70 family RNA polymerase sigma factor [Mucilaginibacter ginsenosidivorans]QEC62075.1 sigma-70 family RNA polymerase sigma factor [Mucilaginibacter ginsenosidivorans]